MGLMDELRAHVSAHATVASDAKDEVQRMYEVRIGTNYIATSKTIRTNSYFVRNRHPIFLNHGTNKNGIREDEAIADDLSDGSSPGEMSPARRSTNRYESEAHVAVATLHGWLVAGALDSLPGFIPGFDGELSRYTDRDDLIGMVRAILDAVPWSLTALERADQFVAVLTPLVATPEEAT